MQKTVTDTSQTRVWIYRSVKKLTEEQETEIAKKAGDFVSQWAAHGHKLAADFTMLYGHYLVFYVDQRSAQASGCSIDSSVALIREIESKHNLGLLDRMQIGFLKNEEVVFYHFQDLKSLYESGKIKDEDLVINPLVQTREEFDEGFVKPFSESVYV